MIVDEDGMLPGLDPKTYLLRKEVQRRIDGCSARVPVELITPERGVVRADNNNTNNFTPQYASNASSRPSSKPSSRKSSRDVPNLQAAALEKATDPTTGSELLHTLGTFNGTPIVPQPPAPPPGAPPVTSFRNSAQKKSVLSSRGGNAAVIDLNSSSDTLAQTPQPAPPPRDEAFATIDSFQEQHVSKGFSEVMFRRRPSKLSSNRTAGGAGLGDTELDPYDVAKQLLGDEPPLVELPEVPSPSNDGLSPTRGLSGTEYMEKLRRLHTVLGSHVPALWRACEEQLRLDAENTHGALLNAVVSALSIIPYVVPETTHTIETLKQTVHSRWGTPLGKRASFMLSTSSADMGSRTPFSMSPNLNNSNSPPLTDSMQQIPVGNWRDLVLRDHFVAWRNATPRRARWLAWGELMGALKEELQFKHTRENPRRLLERHREARKRSSTPTKMSVTALQGLQGGDRAELDRVKAELRKVLVASRGTAEKLREEQKVSKELRTELAQVQDTITRTMKEADRRSTLMGALTSALTHRVALPTNAPQVAVLHSAKEILQMGDGEENLFIDFLKTAARSAPSVRTPTLTTLRVPEVNMVYYAVALHVIDPNCITHNEVREAANMRDNFELERLIVRALETVGITGVAGDDLLLESTPVHCAISAALASMWLLSLTLRFDEMPAEQRSQSEVKTLTTLMPGWRTAALNVIALTLTSSLKAHRPMPTLTVNVTGDLDNVCDEFARLPRNDTKQVVPGESDFVDVSRLLGMYSFTLRSIFHFYGSVADAQSDHPMLVLTSNDAFRLATDCTLDQKKSITRDSIRSLMATLTSRLNPTARIIGSNVEMPSGAFAEFVTRLAAMRYPNHGIVSAVRLTLLTLDNYAGRCRHDLLKTTFLHDANMREVRQAIATGWLPIFRERSAKDIRYASKNVISDKMFLDIIDDMKIIDEHVTHVTLQSLYVHAQDYAGGEAGTSKPMLMTFNEFVFAFVCTALLKFPCPYWPMHLRVRKFIDLITGNNSAALFEKTAGRNAIASPGLDASRIGVTPMSAVSAVVPDSLGGLTRRSSGGSMTTRRNSRTGGGLDRSLKGRPSTLAPSSSKGGGGASSKDTSRRGSTPPGADSLVGFLTANTGFELDATRVASSDSTDATAVIN
eukprot:PhM_4_TR13600/c0_g1_i1/m.60477